MKISSIYIPDLSDPLITSPGSLCNLEQASFRRIRGHFTRFHEAKLYITSFSLFLLVKLDRQSNYNTVRDYRSQCFKLSTYIDKLKNILFKTIINL